MSDQDSLYNPLDTSSSLLYSLDISKTELRGQEMAKIVEHTDGQATEIMYFTDAEDARDMIGHLRSEQATGSSTYWTVES